LGAAAAAAVRRRRAAMPPPASEAAAAGGGCAPRRGCCLAGLRLPLSSSLMSNKLIGRLRTTFLPRCESIKPTVYYFFPILGNSGCGVFRIRDFVYAKIFKLGMYKNKMASYKFSAENQCEIYSCIIVPKMFKNCPLTNVH
jgi:hypothetical protein